MQKQGNNDIDYNDFHGALKKEKDEKAQARLRAFYYKYFKGYKVLTVDYRTGFGKYMQLKGVDKVLCLEKGKRVIEHIWIQEKVCKRNYPNVLFEYEMKSGEAGWAINPHEKAEKLVYYMDGEILMFNFKELRDWLTEHLDEFIDRYKGKTTDNHNLIIPKDVVYDALDVAVYSLSDYWQADDDTSDWIDDDDWIKMFKDD